MSIGKAFTLVRNFFLKLKLKVFPYYRSYTHETLKEMHEELVKRYISSSWRGKSKLEMEIGRLKAMDINREEL